MTETVIGPHLLGRLPRVPDARDYRLENFLGIGAQATAASAADLIRAGEAELKLTTITYKKWAATKYADVTATHWWRAFNSFAQAIAILEPTPTPTPTGDVIWADNEPVLDQGNYGTCVGNGCAQWGNTLPIDDKFNETIARQIYYEATILDGSPDNPDASGGGQQGATVKSGVIALKNRARLNAYAVTTQLSTIDTWLQTKGPIIVGTDWYNDMFTPDANGFIKPTGSYAGGHCFLLKGYVPSKGGYEFLNSWGSGWGVGGRFYMKTADWSSLLVNAGEAWTAVELPLA